MAATAPSEEVPSVTFMLYNSIGMNSVKAKWTSEMCWDLEVVDCAIPEHFKNTKLTQKFCYEKFCEYNLFVIPAHRSPGPDTRQCSGGPTQFSRKTIGARKDRVICKTFRVQAQVLNFPGCRLLWINAYWPRPHGKMGWQWFEIMSEWGK